MLMPISKTATIDKTLFYEIVCGVSVKFGTNLEDIFNIAGFSILSMYLHTADFYFALNFVLRRMTCCTLSSGSDFH